MNDSMMAIQLICYRISPASLEYIISYFVIKNAVDVL